MDNTHNLEEIDDRKHYTPNTLERLSGGAVTARTIRLARDLPRLRGDSWNRVNGADFKAWLASRKVTPAVPDLEAPPKRHLAVLARVAEQVRREESLDARRTP